MVLFLPSFHQFLERRCALVSLSRICSSTARSALLLWLQVNGANCECDRRVWRVDVGMSRGVLNARPQVLAFPCPLLPSDIFRAFLKSPPSVRLIETLARHAQRQHTGTWLAIKPPVQTLIIQARQSKSSGQDVRNVDLLGLFKNEWNSGHQSDLHCTCLQWKLGQDIIQMPFYRAFNHCESKGD